MSVTLSYQPLAVTVVANGNQTYVAPGLGVKTILMLGTAPQGPDYPVLCSPAQAMTLFGSPSAPASAGYTLPFALQLAAAQRQPTGAQPIQFLVCRAGVTNATLALKDGTGSATAITLTARGVYAGSKGTALAATVATPGSVSGVTISNGGTGYTTGSAVTFTGGGGTGATGTVVAGAGGVITGVTITNGGSGYTSAPTVAFTGGTSAVGTAVLPTALTISLLDTSGGGSVLKQQWIGGRDFPPTTATVAQVVAAINGSNPLNNPGSIVQAAAGGSLLPASATGAAFTGSTNDGLGATATDATIAPLLAASLWAHADYVVALFDASAVYTGALAGHLGTARGQNEFRKAVLGPAMGHTYTALTGSYAAAFGADTVVCIGHDAFYSVNPVMGYQTQVDGFYGAAAYAGLKASGPTQETATKFPITGLTGVAYPSDWPPATGGSASASLVALASAGYLCFEQSLADPRLRVYDAITTAPYGANGGVNVFSQFSARDIDDAWSTALVNACTPFLGRVFPSAAAMQQALTEACNAAAAQLGPTIAGYNIQVTVDPNTHNPIVNGTYVMPYPIRNITIPTSFVLAA